MEKLYTVKEVADIYRVPHTTIQYWIRKGKLQAILPGKAYRIRESDLKVFAETHQTMAVKTISKLETEETK